MVLLLVWRSALAMVLVLLQVRRLVLAMVPSLVAWQARARSFALVAIALHPSSATSEALMHGQASALVAPKEHT